VPHVTAAITPRSAADMNKLSEIAARFRTHGVTRSRMDLLNHLVSIEQRYPVRLVVGWTVR
jgi:hypothetical protein